MQSHLNLIKTGVQDVEKRVFPRFPFSYLIFKDSNKSCKTYQVKDISYTGMSLTLKDENNEFVDLEKLEGEIHWYGQKITINGTVKRVNKLSIGIEFTEENNQNKMKDFLSISNIAKSLKPIHEYKEQMELPANLAFWLRCDGPFELFIWQHNDLETSKVQIIMMDNFLEWTDGKGLTSGKILSVQDHDTPLVLEEEFEFLLDDILDDSKLDFAQDVIKNLNQDHLSEDSYNFVCRKFNL